MHQYLSGIQQVGIGVSQATKAMHTYKHLFGMDVLIFDDEAKASLMTQYTGGVVYSRRAILTMNLQGGGGLEIWQFKDRSPTQGAQVVLGQLGINAAILKSRNLKQSHQRLSAIQGLVVSAIASGPDSQPYFYVTDTDSNHFKIIPSTDWFQNNDFDLGGVVGAVIGVSDMEKSIAFYQTILGLDTITYDDFYTENGHNFRKVGLFKAATGKGAFNTLLGNVTVELLKI